MKKIYNVLSLVLVVLCALVWRTNDSPVIADVPEVGSFDQPVTSGESASPVLPDPIDSTVVPNTKLEQSTEEFTTLKGAEALPQTEQQSLWKAFSDARHSIRPLTQRQKELEHNTQNHIQVRYLAQNPRNQLTARFMDNGVKFESGYPGREWAGTFSLGLESRPLEIRQQGTRLEYVHEGIIEWYHNKPEGMEQGFVVTDPITKYTKHTNEGLVIPLLVDGLTVEALEDREDGSNDLQLINDTDEPVISYSGLKAWDANGVALATTMKPISGGLEIMVADAEATYPITIDPLIASLETKITASDGWETDFLGSSVSISGDTLLIGAYGDDDGGANSGSAYLFRRTGTNWLEQAKLTASDASAGDEFGYSVSVEGNTAVVGARKNDDSGSQSGSAYIFFNNGTNWLEQAKLTASDAAAGDYFGHSVSISGESVLISAILDDAGAVNNGSAYIFVRTGTAWIQQAKLVPSGVSSEAWSGRSVCISGDTAVIGSENNGGNLMGRAFVFVRNGSSWSQQQMLIASDTSSNNRFGWSVDISDMTIVVGAYHSTALGSAYVYVYDGSNWVEQAILTESDPGGTTFGVSVSIDNDTIVVGDEQVDDHGSASGAVYIYERTGASWDKLGKITAYDGDAADFFGRSTDLVGDTLVVGSQYDDDKGNASGSAYVYRIPIPLGEISVFGSSGLLMDGGSENFGNQAIGITKALTLSISNEATNNLTGLDITKDGADASSFVVEDLDVSSPGEGEFTTFRVTYTPPSAGSHTAAVHIASNDPDENPFDITLTGTGLPNADSDPGSDAWETANGFDPNMSGDVMTLDSDGDGSPDIWEMYQGTDRYGSGGGSFASMVAMASAGDDGGNGLSNVSVSNGILKVQYRRDSTQTVVNAQSIWVPDLTASNWLYSGESYSGAVVTVTENVVSNGPAFEIIEAASEVTSGDTEALFYTLELTPNE